MQAKPTADILDMALDGAIFEVLGENGEYVEVNLPETKVSGFVLRKNTVPWIPPKARGMSPVLVAIFAIAIVLALGGLAMLLWTRAKRTQDVAERAASIPSSIKRAEELFRSEEYGAALTEFKSYLDLQGGEVRNPDVYRRLTVCYQKTDQHLEAAKAWEKMKALGGLKGMDDYALGVEVMVLLGREEQAAQIYEQLLERETDEERVLEIRQKLFETYRRLKQPEHFVRHTVWLLESTEDNEAILDDAVNFLITQGKTDLVLETNHKSLITAICNDFLEDDVKTPQAGRIYLKCLEFDRTDLRLHQLLAEVYEKNGDYKRAVSELSILNQLDKSQADQYMDQAAKIYVDNARVQEAIGEGNPIIIKKIAQMYLARSEVHPDAVAIYEKVLEYQPRAVGINKMLSTVYLTRGDLTKYMDKLRLLHEIDGHNHDYLTGLAKCIIDNDLIDEAIREGNRELNAKILKQLIKTGASDDQAVALFEKLVKFEPQNVLIRSALVRAYEAREDFAKAIEHMVTLSQLKTDDAELAERAAALAVQHNCLGTVADKAGSPLLETTAKKVMEKKVRSPESKEVLEKALQVNPLLSGARDFLRAFTGMATRTPQTEAATKSGTAIKSGMGVKSGTGTRSETGIKSDTGLRFDSGVRKTRRSSLEQVPQQPKEQAPKLVGKETVSVPPPRPDRPQASPTRQKKPEAVHPPQPPTPPVSRPAVKPFPAPAPPRRGDEGRGEQLVDLSEATPREERVPVTTFVSGFAKRGAHHYQREELYLPAAGGFAYKDMELVSTDGWGRFHVALEVNTGRTVMMRIFSDEIMDPTFLKEFMREATQLALNIVHESILPVEETVTGPSGAQALVHPSLLRPVDQICASGRRPDVATVPYLALKILDGLGYAHNYQGLDGKLRRTYHLHLHPSQVFVNGDFEECRIASLGYSQIYRNLTRAAKPRYLEPGMNPETMPPEFFRARGARVQEKSSDIYSFGILLHYLLSGVFPFEGPSFEDYKFQHSKIYPAPVRLVNPETPEWLESIILKCLEKDPEKRWDSVAEMQTEFARHLK